ncbi:phosphoglycerate dehydrogenase [Cohnella cellulosilytica]|uniref:Phosphoglycerate dehydrogenase n=1 Tax=Cohnella cellulosilytica TaxID=986710 RepID=A0ABW2FJ51_9BACL
MTKIVVTPRSFARHSREPLDMLKRQGYEVVLNPFGRIMTKEEIGGLIADADAVIVGVDPLDREVLEKAERLKVISKYGIGTDNIDTSFAQERGIAVSVAAGANTDAVADYTFALMLAAARKLTVIDQECRKRNWTKLTTLDVCHRTLGLLGMGNIGKAVARRAAGFDMKIIAFDTIRDPAFAEANGIAYAERIEDVLRTADFISLHLPLNERTRHMIGRAQFAMMKPTAVLVNTARGGLIDEEALYETLKAEAIWGAGVDVFEEEPPGNAALLELDNLIIGSHCAASTVSAVDNMGLIASRNAIHAIEGLQTAQ